MTLRDDGLQPGDIKFKPGAQVPLETDGTGVKGAPVVFDADGKVTPATDAADYIGQLGEEPRWDGHVVDVRVAGLCVVGEVSDAVTAGDYVVPDGANAFRAFDSANDTEHKHLPFTLHDAAAGETVVLCYR